MALAFASDWRNQFQELSAPRQCLPFCCFSLPRCERNTFCRLMNGPEKKKAEKVLTTPGCFSNLGKFAVNVKRYRASLNGSEELP